ncbi:MAG: T9SS type A sorting domain-containing protein, partial [Bacteroidales bacterium]|jgi:hypothetical protein|nr:T9SS type A sorting domain-containing protein [Bacteroidales bacterium]
LESDKLEVGEYSFELTSSSHGTVKSYTHTYTPTASAVLKAYPNPAVSGQEVTVEGCGDGYIEIYNAVGKLVQQVKPNGNVTVMTLNQPSGVYFVRTNRQTIKVIIKK